MMASCSSPSLSVTVAVDKATSELLLTPDWTIIIAICDSLNSHRWQGKEAIKAVKRRLQHKNAKVQLLALTLLEAMVKNCGEHLHSQIAEKHLLGEMVKIVRKKGNFEVRNKILMLLDTWHEAFGGIASRYPHYNWAYEELRRSGIRFPERSQQAALMLRTSEARPSLAQSSSGHLLSSGSFRRLDETMATEIESLSLSSLESMRNVMDLVKEMVQAVNPADSSALKDELMVDLVDRCRSNQKKLIQMLTTTADEEVLARGLELNDSMQGVLARHDAIASGVPLPLSQAATSETQCTDSGKRTSETSSDVTAGTVAAASEPVASSSSSESETDEEEEGDIAQLAKRQAQIWTEESEEELLLGKNDDRTTETQAAPQATQCKDLVLSEEDGPTSRTKAEQDIIDLLSLTLSTTVLPSTQPEMHPSFAQQSTHQTPSSTEQILLNSYIVPWAQCQPEDGSLWQSQLQQKAQLNTIGPQPQYVRPHTQSYSQWQPQHQQKAQLHPVVAHFQSVTQPQLQPQFSYGYPPAPWAGGETNTNNNTMWNQRMREGASVQQQKVLEKHVKHSNTLHARGSSTGSSSNAVNAETKPYIPPYRLFEDLNVFWNADGHVRSSR